MKLLLQLQRGFRSPLSRKPLARSRPTIRSYSSREYESRSYNVTCGSAGSVTVDICNIELLRKATNPLWIYLPPTGSHPRATNPPIPSFFRLDGNAFASIKYRWNHVPLPSTSTSSSLETSSPSPALLTSHPSYANHPFPTPLHDILHAYEFLTTVFLPSFSSKNQDSSTTSNSTFSPESAYFNPPPSRKKVQRPIVIYGSYLSGGLATSLALTESFASKQQPHYIAGLIVKNGIFDWTDIATSLPPLSPEEEIPILHPKNFAYTDPKYFSWDKQTLHSVKGKLFTNPASTFDPFVSPVLFFRTSGLNVPRTWPENEPPSTSDEIEGIPQECEPFSPSSPKQTASQSPSPLSNLNPTQFPPSENDSDPYSPTVSPSDSQPESPFPTSTSPRKTVTETNLEPPQRKSHVKFPTNNSGLKIPRSLFLTSSSPSPPPAASKKGKTKKIVGDGVTPVEQAEEMATLMRRSIVLHEFKERRVWDEDSDPEEAAAERVKVHVFGEEIDGFIEEDVDLGNRRRKRVGKREWWEEGGDSGIDGIVVDPTEEEKVVEEWLEQESLG